MNHKNARFDGPFWAALLAGIALVGTLGFLGLAAAAQDAAQNDAPPMALDDS